MRDAVLPWISVWNRQRKVALDRARLEHFAYRALPLCARESGSGLTSLAEIDVLLVSDRRIAELHRRFMKIDGPTDVITFQHGEIFISAEMARRQAKSRRTTLAGELRLYLLHGLLHLQGFDDRRTSDRRQMVARQERILACLPG